MELPAGVLRPAQLGDWQRIAELEQQIFGTEAWPPEFVAAELAATEGPGADRRYWVVEAEGQV
ncbi:MAG: hypothetical protein LBO75_02550, partial [Bifidobacteriaceae bacterium]|nr:hypothetical protein [Bifidobacteriaceae bacterium]